MNLLDREFIGEFFKTFGFLLLFLGIVFLVKIYLDFYDEISLLGSQGAWWALIHFAYRLPRFYVESGVVSVAASILWIVTRKARTNEILAWLSGGIGPARLAIPLIVAAIGISAASLALNEFVVTEADSKADYVEKRWLKNKPEEEITQTGNIYQRGAGGRLYLIDRYDPAMDRMHGPTIIDLHEGEHSPAWILHADVAYPVDARDGSEWEFLNATVRRMDREGRVEEFRHYERVTDRDLGTPMEPRLRSFLSNLGDPERMNVAQLLNYIKLLDAQGKPTREYVLILHTKLALPFAVIVIAVLMCAHVLRPRAQGILVGFGGGLAWIALYYAAFVLCQRLGDAGGAVHPGLAIWLPNVGFGVTGLVMLTRASA